MTYIDGTIDLGSLIILILGALSSIIILLLYIILFINYLINK
jgi:hypothetical protein